MQVIFSRISLVACMFFGNAQSQTFAGCVPIDNAGFLITLPGAYCVTKDLNTRFDFADHSAENSIIEIRVSNVTVDLQGHRIGRGRFIIQRGGNGIVISTKQIDGERGASPRMSNVTIRNGVLADFGAGILYYASAYQRPTLPHQVRKIADNSFIYDEANISMENLKFVRCGKDMNFQDWVTR